MHKKASKVVVFLRPRLTVRECFWATFNRFMDVDSIKMLNNSAELFVQRNFVFLMFHVPTSMIFVLVISNVSNIHKLGWNRHITLDNLFYAPFQMLRPIAYGTYYSQLLTLVLKAGWYCHAVAVPFIHRIATVRKPPGRTCTALSLRSWLIGVAALLLRWHRCHEMALVTYSVFMSACRLVPVTLSVLSPQ